MCFRDKNAFSKRHSIENDSPPCLTALKVAVHLRSGRGGGGGEGGTWRGGGGVEMGTGGPPYDVDIVQGHAVRADVTPCLQHDLV